MKRIAVMVSLLLGVSGAAQAATCMDNGEGAAWKARYPAIYTSLMSYFTCVDASDPTACNVFVARAAEGIYGVTDFRNADGTYMSANTIMDYVHASPTWSRLGMADSQATLNDAAAGAEDHLIIAVMSDQPHGHVALVLPGDPQPSGNWHRNVPNSASAFLGDVSRAYVFCKLSWAFQDPARVELWWRPRGH
jgi:hypothetical protein